MLETSDRPNSQELYVRAGNARNLRSEADRRGSADVLIAAGWVTAEAGKEMMRLHSEWDAAEKVRSPGKSEIKLLAVKLPRLNGRADVVAAGRQMGEWHAQELRALVGKLRSLPLVLVRLETQAERWGIQDSKHVSAAVALYWVRPVGRNVPCGEDGRRMMGYMEDCVNRARQSIRNSLQGFRKRV